MDKRRLAVNGSIATNPVTGGCVEPTATLPPMMPRKVSLSRLRATTMFTLVAQSVGGRYHIASDITSAHCLIVLSFGYRRAPTGLREPGPCNEYLSNNALVTSHDRPIVAQVEIDQAIRSLREGLGADYVIRSARDPQRYLDTHECGVQVRSIMDDRGWKTAVLIAHPYHLPRAQAVFAALDIETATPAGVRAIWDRRSGQVWTRCRPAWAVRELLALWLYQRRGWISRPAIREAPPAPRSLADRACDPR